MFFSSEKALILYFSRGLVFKRSEVYEAIARYNALLCHQVVISTYTLKTGTIDVQWHEELFMHDLAAQNFSRYHIHSTYPSSSPQGISLTLSNADYIPTLLSNFSQVLPYRPSNMAKLGLPVEDLSGQGLVVPFFKACFSGSKQSSKPEDVIGVVGLDIQLEDVAEQVTYFTSMKKDVYAFLMSPEGECSSIFWIYGYFVIFCGVLFNVLL